MKDNGMIYLDDSEFDTEKLTREIMGEEGNANYLAEKEAKAKKDKERRERTADRQLTMAEKNSRASKDFEEAYRAKRKNKDNS